MDGREPGNMVIGPSSYGAGATNSSIATENWTGMMHELQISYSSMCRFKQVDVAGSLYQGDDLSGNAPMKKMRGRPDGTNSLASTPSSDSGYSKSPGSDPTAKHLGTSGIGFTHVIFVEVGEDIASKIMAFSQLGPRAILFYQQMASSLVEKLLISDPCSMLRVFMQGLDEISSRSRSGSFLLTEDNGTHIRSSG